MCKSVRERAVAAWCKAHNLPVRNYSTLNVAKSRTRRTITVCTKTVADVPGVKMTWRYNDAGKLSRV